MIEFEGFDWDEANGRHATRHGISRQEIEQALLAGFLETNAYVRSGELRHAAVARTPSGVLIEIVVVVRGGRLRPITAHKVKRAKRGLYERKI
jgi:uncharacterized DUF497 family protein